MRTSVTYANKSRTVSMISGSPMTVVRSGPEYVSVKQNAGQTDGTFYSPDMYAYGDTHIFLTRAEAIELAYKLLGEAHKEVTYD